MDTMTQELSKRSIIAVAKEQVSCDLAGEAAIMDLKSGQYYGLNPIGARVWSLIQQPKSIGEILQTLLGEYEVDAEKCESDLLALLQALHAKALIEIHEGTAD